MPRDLMIGRVKGISLYRERDTLAHFGLAARDKSNI
jgi:hypothetical protein